MVKILQKEDKVLRTIARPVPKEDIDSPKIGKIISTMKKAMRAEEDAVAIAAPQIGESLRIFIVSGKTLALIGKEKEGSPETGADKQDKQKEVLPDLVFINPKVLRISKKTHMLEEGCLSVRWLYGDVRRAEKVTVQACDEKGNLFTRGASGLLAQIFQPETEHLDGKLFIDKAMNIKELPPKELKEKRHAH